MLLYCTVNDINLVCSLVCLGDVGTSAITTFGGLSVIPRERRRGGLRNEGSVDSVGQPEVGSQSARR